MIRRLSRRAPPRGAGTWRARAPVVLLSGSFSLLRRLRRRSTGRCGASCCSGARPGPNHGRGGGDFVQAAFGGIDQVGCGAGNDLVSADLGDRVANCETVVRRLSVDPYLNDDSQHETGVEPDSFSFGSTIVTAFQLGRRAAGAAANIGTAVSRDAGRTWRRSALPGVTAVSRASRTGDLGVRPDRGYDALHGTWLVGLLTLEPGNSHVYVARSTDGEHWSAPVDVASGPVLDKDWFVCDNGAASPFRGRCYAEYTDDDRRRTVSKFSNDGGATWSTPVRSTTTLVGTQPVVRPDGTLVVVAGDYNGRGRAQRLDRRGPLHRRRRDVHAHDRGEPHGARQRPDAGDRPSVGGHRRRRDDLRVVARLPLPHRLRRKRHRHLDLPGRRPTWTAPARVPTRTGVLVPQRVHPGPRGGSRPARAPRTRVRVLTRLRHARGVCTLGIGFTTSPDGGSTWSPPRRLHAQPFSTDWLPRASFGRMIGDYFSTSFAGDRVVPVFALATSPLNGRFRQAIFATSLPASG